ncbi:MAG: signal peptide peptidase SppA [bacterium]
MKNFFKTVGAMFVALILFTVVSGFFSLILLIGIASMSSTPVTKITSESVFKLKLDGTIVERSENSDLMMLRNLINESGSSVAIDDVRESLKKAADNKNIKALYLDCAYLSGSPALVEELRSLIVNFKEQSNKPVYAYGDSYSQSSYWLATVADTLILNPQGSIILSGVQMQTMFMKRAMDKLGVEMQIFKVGTFKSAVEPYFRTDMSDENRLQMQRIADIIWAEIVDDIAEARNISTEQIDEYVNRGGFLNYSDVALNAGLVDALKYRSDADAMVKELLGDDVKMVSLQDMVNLPSTDSYASNKIAVLYATGGIDDGSDSQMKSENIVKELNKLAKSDKVKAVVLRVNSPGGAVFGSEQMWYAAKQLREKKPLIVSMSGYAASGGYYMSCIADTILAYNTTLTGSIGIFGTFPNVQGVTNKLGVDFDGVKTHELATFGDMTRPMTPAEKAILQNYIEQGYEQFTARCADGRQMPIDDIKAIAEGRVWMGSDAVNIGLVDAIGGYADAIAIAAERASLDDNYSVAEYPAKKDIYTILMEEFNLEMSTRAVKSKLGEYAYLYDQYMRLLNARGAQALMPYYIQM